jgi:hypothetical protein
VAGVHHNPRTRPKGLRHNQKPVVGYFGYVRARPRCYYLEMPCESEVDPERRLVKVRAWDVVTYAELMAARLKFTRDPAFDPDFFQLYDLSEVKRAPITEDQVRQLATDAVFSSGSRRAFVASSAFSYGLTRMFATYREINGGREQIELFRSVAAAEEWLGLKNSK